MLIPTPREVDRTGYSRALGTQMTRAWILPADCCDCRDESACCRGACYCRAGAVVCTPASPSAKDYAKTSL